MPNTNGDTPLKLFRFKYRIEGTPWSNSVDIRAVSLEAAYEKFDEYNTGWDRWVESVIQLN